MTVSVARHRTAMSRAALSRPMALALADGLLPTTTSIFDYGCGKGDDIRNLAGMGYVVDGYDAAHRPFAERRPAAVVNLGYVINVIEDARERADALRQAWALAERLLVVSARLTWDARDLVGRPHGDGLITRTGTFQRFYEQPELGAWIESVLGVRPVAAAPGIFYVFRDEGDGQTFLAARVYTYRPRITVDPHTLYEANERVLAPLLEFLTRHARPPRSSELASDELAAIQEAFATTGRALRLIRQVTPDALWEQVRIQRRNELLIYIAMSRFTSRPRFSQLTPTLAADIKALFGSYQDACVQADRLLLACGDPALILVSARSSKVGKQTPSALYVHGLAVGELPPVLRVYEACARVLAGTVESANMIKLSVTQPQVSYLTYPAFDRDAHPALASAVTVNLRQLSVDWRDYSRSDNPPVLHRKEEFIALDDERRPLYERLTRSEIRAGLYAHPECIGTRDGWSAVLAAAGKMVRGHRLQSVAPTRASS
jgi:DNA phosphorothioation-associated putative methyltransferase